MNSKDKGKRGEREVAGILRDLGFRAHRGQQYQGGNDSPDIIHEMQNVHVEVFYGDPVPLKAKLNQAIRDCEKRNVANTTNVQFIPAVMHRRISRKMRGEPWLVTVQLLDLPAFCRAVVDATKECKPGSDEPGS